jgi:protein-tyrosine kinase
MLFMTNLIKYPRLQSFKQSMLDVEDAREVPSHLGPDEADATADPAPAAVASASIRTDDAFGRLGSAATAPATRPLGARTAEGLADAQASVGSRRGRAKAVPIAAPGDSEFQETQIHGVQEALIGEILARSNDLRVEQVEQVLAYQRKNSVKFGEAAVALGFVKKNDVMWALGQQFHYVLSSDRKDETDKFSDELVIAKHPFSTAAEVVRDIRSLLLDGVLNPDAKPRRGLAVTSTRTSEGRTWLAANLAVALSQTGARTLLIDADLRTGRLHEVFGLSTDSIGLSSMLAGRAQPKVIRPVRELPCLYLLPSGAVPPNPLELLQGRAFQLLVRELLGKFDHVIMDTSAANAGADCRVAASRVGAALIVGRKGLTPMVELENLARRLSKTDAQLAGVVMNNV